MSILARYRKIPRNVLVMITAEFLVQLVSLGFFLILNIYLRKEGYLDDEIASFVSLRFLAIWIFALPLGVLIRDLPLRPFLFASVLLVPGSGAVILSGVDLGNESMVYGGFLAFGVGMMLLEVCILPFIMRHCQQGEETEAISLSYSSFSIAMVVAGALIAILTQVEQSTFWGFVLTWDEPTLLYMLVFMSLGGLFLVYSVPENVPERGIQSSGIKLKGILKDYDWKIILKALLPTTIIAVGAGLTIPFMNLFFYSVFELDSDGYSLLGMATAVLISAGALLVPSIRRRYGYRVAITLSQCLAVLFLVLLAMTELWAGPTWVFMLAIGCFMVRQPLMNMAGPMTSELILNYVGKRNQELVSALVSAIWSGSWFISAKVFQWFRASDLPYWQIFLITAGLYLVGIVLYFRLIQAYEIKVKTKTSKVN